MRLLLAALACLAALFAVPAIASASFNIPPSTFEGGDGDTLVNNGGTDWNSPAPNLTQKTDNDGGPQTAFVTGSKEQDPGNWDLGTASAPSKADILHAAYANEVVGGDLFFYGAFERLDGSGNANVSFELNQVGPPNNLFDNGNDPVPFRSDGDLLITFDGNNSTGVRVGMCIWHGNNLGESADPSFGWYPLPGFGSTSKLKGSDNCTTLTTVNSPTAIGSMNNGSITPTGLTPDFSSSIADNRFGEMSVDVSQALENAGIVNPCLSFGSAWIHSRSSDAALSSMQDYVEPTGISAATPCSIDLEKSVAVQKPAGPVPGPTDYADADTAGSAVFANTGDTLHYLVKVTNPGQNAITLLNDPPTDTKCTLSLVSKLHPTLANPNAPDGSTGTLDPGDVWTYSCTHLYGVGDADLYTNVATAIGAVGNPAGCTVNSALPCVHDTDPANVRRFAHITIVKDRLPGTSNDSFAFGTSTDLVNQGIGGFSLSDDGVAGHNTVTYDVLPNDAAGGGSYVVTEKDLSDAAQQPNASNYNLTDLQCTGNGVGGSTQINSSKTSGSATIVVGSGGTVTCTFTNTKQATINVVKDNVGGDPNDSFNYDPSSDLDANNFPLVDDGTSANTKTYHVLPNSGTGGDATKAYSVSELDLSNAALQPDGAGYRLTSLSCPGNGAGGSTSIAGNNLSGSADIKVTAGQTITCTFTNTKNATIVVDKVNNGGDPADAFNFHPSSDLSGSDFPVSQAGSPQSFSVSPNIGAQASSKTYTVAETDLSNAAVQPAGYRLTGISCPANGAGGSTSIAGNNLSGNADVKVAAGDTVTCTFTNTKNAHIVVDKVNNGGDPADAFNFHPSSDLSGSDFPVSQAGSPQDFEVAPNIGAGSVSKSYTVAETDLSDAAVQPAGYRLTDISCPTNGAGGSSSIAGDNLSGNADVKVAAGDTVTCTFTNSKNGKVEIEKINDGGAKSDSFPFDASSALSPDFSLKGGETKTISDVVPNTGAGSTPATYTVQEGATAAGYRLVGLTCNDGDSTTSLASKTATLNVSVGETVHCTFTNRFTAPGIAIDKSGPATATAGDLLPYTLTVTNPGQESLAASTVVVTDPQCTSAPTLQAKNTGSSADATPNSLDPGDSWVYTCSGQTQSGQTSFDNQACVAGTDEFGRTVNACDSVTTTLAQIVVAGERVVPGEAHIAGKTGCVARKFKVRVAGRQIDHVVIRIDGKRRADLHAAANGSVVFTVDPRKFKPGSHLLVAKTFFVADSGTPPKTLKLRFARCVRRTAPASRPAPDGAQRPC